MFARYWMIGCVAIVFHHSGARAQETATTDSPQDATQSLPTLEEVVVTARRREGYDVEETSAATKIPTPIMELPQAVQIVPHQVLLDQQSQTLSEVLDNVSGVQLTGSRFSLVDQYAARGFELDPRSNFYKNGRPFAFIAPPPVDTLESVEFLKGPASVLYGQSEPGGIVNMVLKAPTRTTFAEVSAQAGSDEFRKGHIDAGGPLGKSLGYRFNAVYETANSFRDFAFSKQRVGSAAVRWSPWSRLTFNVDALYQQREQTADSGLIFGPALPGQRPDQNFGRYNRVADLPRSRSLNEPWTRIELKSREMSYDLSLALTEHWRIKQQYSWRFQETAELRVDPVNLFSTSVPSAGIERGDLVRVGRDREREQKVQYADAFVLGEHELGFLDSKFLLGGDWLQTDMGFRDFRLIGFADNFNIYAPVYSELPATLGRAPFFLGRESLAQRGVYAQEQLTLFDRWHWILGARKDRYANRLDTTIFFAGVPSNNELFDDENEEQTYRAGMLVEITRDISTYASYSQGFTPNISVFSDQVLPAQLSEQWEFGAKFSLLGNRLLTTAAVYELVKTNVVQVNPVSQTLELSGARLSRGLELDVTGELAPNLNVVANYAYLYARITEDDPRSSATVGVSSVSTIGNIPPGAPRHKGGAWAVYRFKNETLQGWRAGLGFSGRSLVQGDVHNSLQHERYVLWNAMLGYELRGNAGVFDVQLKLNNLTDQTYFNSFNGNFIQPGKPFTAIAQIKYRFGSQ